MSASNSDLTPKLPEQFMNSVFDVAAEAFRGRSHGFLNHLGFWVVYGRLPKHSQPHYRIEDAHYGHRVADELRNAGYRIWGRGGGKRGGWVIIFHNPPLEPDRPLTRDEERGIESIPYLGSDEHEASQIAQSIAAKVLLGLHAPVPKLGASSGTEAGED